MDQLKIWLSHEDKDDKLVACYQQKIYKANPKTSELDIIASEFKRTKEPLNSFLAIPFIYIKEIRFQEQKNYIEILFGKDSYEHLIISDESRKIEIFEYFSSISPDSIKTIERYSKLKAGKKPLSAIAVIGLIFLWTLYIALSIESGDNYEIKGSPGSLAGAVLALASLGSIKIITIFLPLLLIAAVAFIIKIKEPPIFRRTILRK